VTDAELLDPPIRLQFEDPKLLQLLCGDHDRNLVRLEQKLNITVAVRGDILSLDGPVDAVNVAKSAVQGLVERITQQKDKGQRDKGQKEKGQKDKVKAVEIADVDAAIAFAQADDADDGLQAFAENRGSLQTWKRPVVARSPTQGEYLEKLQTNELVFGLGPAGTGKTYLAVAVAVAMMKRRQVDRIILSRPAVEAGERLGFLPGDMKEKVDPYLRPLYDALYDMMPPKMVEERLTSGEIEVAPLAFMRGRTLANSFVILDEAQNTTPTQMKMFLTRLGENGRMAVTGDVSQTDLPLGAKSGLTDALEVLQGVKGIGFVQFTHADVVRHPLVTRIVRAYDHAHPSLLKKPGEGSERR